MSYFVDRNALLQLHQDRAQQLAGWGQRFEPIQMPPTPVGFAPPQALAPLPIAQAQPNSTLLEDLLKLGLVALGTYAAVQVVRAATRTVREKHDHVTKKLATRLAKDPGWLFVSADVKGWPKPPVIDGARGDVYAEHEDGTRLLVEVEHEHTVDEPHFRDHQAPRFGRWERRSPKNIFALELTGYRRK